MNVIKNILFLNIFSELGQFNGNYNSQQSIVLVVLDGLGKVMLKFMKFTLYW